MPTKHPDPTSLDLIDGSLYSAGVRQPTTPALQRQPALLRAVQRWLIPSVPSELAGTFAATGTSEGPRLVLQCVPGSAPKSGVSKQNGRSTNGSDTKTTNCSILGGQITNYKQYVEIQSIVCVFCSSILHPFSTAVPIWGQISLVPSGSSPKRDCSTERVNKYSHHVCYVPRVCVTRRYTTERRRTAATFYEGSLLSHSST